jgi:undecaprenyl-diphosphatase
MPTWFDIIVLSIVEGITEFLPISSTGHMIITQRLLHIESTEQLEAFLVIVQGGAILAVITVFWATFLRWLKAWVNLLPLKTHFGNPGDLSRDRYQSLFVASAVIPFGILGFLLHKQIKSLFDLHVVAWALITGGLAILFSNWLFARQKPHEKQTKELTLKDALILGLGQCLALWPGFSRSAATIITGRLRGYSQGSAAELSFLIGLPTLFGAASYEMIKEAKVLDATWLGFLGGGILIAWIVAYIFVKAFIFFLQRYSMNVFAYYRLLVGAALLWFF